MLIVSVLSTLGDLSWPRESPDQRRGEREEGEDEEEDKIPPEKLQELGV